MEIGLLENIISLFKYFLRGFKSILLESDKSSLPLGLPKCVIIIILAFFLRSLEIPLQNLSILVSSEILLLFIGTLRSALISNLLLLVSIFSIDLSSIKLP